MPVGKQSQLSNFMIHPSIALSLQNGLPVVALESAVITHGLPFPQNLELARQMEREVRDENASPATIAVIAGKVHIGLEDDELQKLADPGNPSRKISRRDFGIASARGENGGTTVAGTLIAASAVGIRVFATGGIGGVHRNAPFDISADLQELGHTPMIVVCAGAKAILDLPATLEVLETMGIPVLGFQTEELPAFYSRESGLPVTLRVENVNEVVSIASFQWRTGLKGAVLVVVPPPQEYAIPAAIMSDVVERALAEAEVRQIRGSAVTPFLLNRVAELSHGNSLQSNLALLKNNACLAAKIAVEWSRVSKIMV